jgi:ion channel
VTEAAGGKAPAPSRLAHGWRRHPSAILLAVQLLGILAYPLMENTGTGRALFGAMSIAVLSLVLWIVNRGPSIHWVAWLVAVPSVVLSLLANFAAMPALLPFAQALESILYFYAVAGLIRYMLGDLRVTNDELIAAATTFTLMAWAFAYAYSACQAWVPGSFSEVTVPPQPRTWMELLFLSFSTLSGVGLSDIVPLTPLARALTMLAMFAGVMYIAIVVSRLIALTVIRQQGH